MASTKLLLLIIFIIMLFAVLRAMNLCIRGSRVKWRRLRMELGFHTCQNEFLVFLLYLVYFLVASVVVCVCFVCYSLVS